jgi:hypothetical protein
MTARLLSIGRERHNHKAPMTYRVGGDLNWHTEIVRSGAVGQCECGEYLVLRNSRWGDYWQPISERKARRLIRRTPLPPRSDT